MDGLIIQVDSCFELADIKLEVLTYLGSREDVYYFKTLIHRDQLSCHGLLRIGSSTGGLHRELLLRDYLKEHKMICPLLKISKEINPKIIIPEGDHPKSDNDIQYLEEEYYLEDDIFSSPQEKIILLSHYPENPLDFKDLTSSLVSITQICQFFRYLSQSGWCFISLMPEYIEKGSLVCFFDLTCAYPLNSQVTLTNPDYYCVGELIYKHPVQEQDSSYVIGKLIAKVFDIDDEFLSLDCLTLEQKKVPLLWQILSLSLYPLAQKRPSLSQLLSLLVALRKNLSSIHPTYWEIVSESIVGLSQHRLTNEDSYIIRQKTSNSSALIMAAVADGMGGLAKGEVASNSAIEVLGLADFPNEGEDVQNYLNELINKANGAVRTNARDGGTTLSIVFIKRSQLNIAHIGDSRIYLIRDRLLCQLSQDHSLVTMLIASGQIAPHEALNHPDRSVLLRSLGSKPQITSDYIHSLKHFGQDDHLLLKDRDLLVICSDGVWDHLTPEEMVDIFEYKKNGLQDSLEKAIEEIIQRGAQDNATLIALRIHLSHE